jgi:hypothetical protein
MRPNASVAAAVVAAIRLHRLFELHIDFLLGPSAGETPILKEADI